MSELVIVGGRVETLDGALYVEPCRMMNDDLVGHCDLPVTLAVVHRRNLVCDRFLYGRCERGHPRMIALPDEPVEHLCFSDVTPWDV